MTFMALTINKAMLTQQQSQLQYQEVVATNKYNYVTSQLQTLSDKEVDSAAGKKLEAYQEQYQQEESEIESRLKVIENQLASYDKAIDSNIKNDCKFSVSA
jgi:alpha-D-ribose 1-methylphosphonate 5-triphosphate diphosphatase PhnM